MKLEPVREIPFHKILFATDFSAATYAMVPQVRDIACRCHAELTLLHAFNAVQGYDFGGYLDSTARWSMNPVPYETSIANLRNQEREQLEELVSEQFAEVDCTPLMEDGDPATVICGVAGRDGIDLIMMPTRGLGTFRRLLLGSVTAKVLHDVGCAVFTSAHELDPACSVVRGYRSIISALEYNEEAANILETTKCLGKLWESRVSLIHISGGIRPQDDDSNLLAFRERLGIDEPVRVLKTDVADGIRQVALEESADLVVTGRGHDRGTVSKLWSDLYEIVRESPCPVLSV